MHPISAVIITFNEARNIGRCLDSLEGVADDIVVVDSFSTDATEQICREKGARFIRHSFEGYIEQKNWALTQAKHPYCLSLDADEALSDALRASILEAKKNWRTDAWTMNRLTNYCGKWIRHSGWYPDVKLRLFDRRKGRWGGINPHDKYEMVDNVRPRHLQGDLLHYSYYSISEHIKQADHFSTVAAKAMFAMGKKSGPVQRYLNPAARFLRDYFIRLGFLDGFEGYTICRISAMTTYLKYAKLKHLNDGKEG